MQRRDFLQMGLLSSAGMLCRKNPLVQSLVSAHEPIDNMAPAARQVENSTPATLAPYVTALALPTVIESRPAQELYITLREAYQTVHRDLKPTRIWGYNGM